MPTEVIQFYAPARVPSRATRLLCRNCHYAEHEIEGGCPHQFRREKIAA